MEAKSNSIEALKREWGLCETYEIFETRTESHEELFHEIINLPCHDEGSTCTCSISIPDFMDSFFQNIPQLDYFILFDNEQCS